MNYKALVFFSKKKNRISANELSNFPPKGTCLYVTYLHSKNERHNTLHFPVNKIGEHTILVINQLSMITFSSGIFEACSSIVSTGLTYCLNSVPIASAMSPSVDNIGGLTTLCTMGFCRRVRGMMNVGVVYIDDSLIVSQPLLS